MNRKLLSTAVIFLAAVMATPLAQARDGRGDPRPAYRETYVERHHYRSERHRGWDRGRHYGWHKPRPHHPRWHHGHHYRPHYRVPAPYYYGPPRHRPHHYHGHHHHGHRHSSAAPIILGSVIGGVVGHEIGYGDPGHTAVGAVVGTVIGYEIARHR